MPNRHTTTPPHRHARHCRAGFTLIEAALTMVIVGTGILAMVSAQQAYHIKNNWAQRTGTAQLLANELREITMGLPQHDPIGGDANLGPESNELVRLVDWDDLDDFAGTVTSGKGAGETFNPPVNGLREPIVGLDQWSQRIRVENVLSDNLAVPSAMVQNLGTTDTVRITVDVVYQKDAATPAQTVTSLTWHVTR